MTETSPDRLAAPTRLDQQLADATDALKAASATPRLDAETLLSYATGFSPAQLIARATEPLELPVRQKFMRLIRQRTQGKPVAYLTGTREFYSLPFKVNEHVLIPRPETELLVDLALGYLPPDSPASVLDLGTGSGAMGIAIARHRPKAAVTAVELSADALALAKRNADYHAVSNLALLEGSWFEPLPAGAHFDLIVSNPPYISGNDPHLELGDVRFEPREALVAADAGLAAFIAILADVSCWLSPGGRVALEHGFDQGEAVRSLCRASGLTSVRTHRDLAGLERVTEASGR